MHLRVNRWMRPDADYNGRILFLETSEEMPCTDYVYRVLMNLGERLLLQRFSALLMGRPKGWDIGRHNSPEQRAAYVEGQHDAVRRALASYAPDLPVVLDVDFGHTDPQLAMPYGGPCRIDPQTQRITMTY